MPTIELHKTLVITTPMTRLEYNRLRGWAVPEDENPEDNGYLIQDVQGNANVPGYEGYCSWKPETEMGDKYITLPGTIVDYQHPKPHVQRVLIELADLTARTAKLEAFFQTDTFKKTVPDAQKTLLYSQVSLHRKLIAVLTERIKLES